MKKNCQHSVQMTNHVDMLAIERVIASMH